MILDTYFFILFLLGILQFYILSSIPDHYKKMQSNLLKSIVNKKVQIIQDKGDELIQYFNLATQLFMIIGILTPYWYIFISSMVIISVGNKILNTIKLSPENINKSLNFSIFITYFIVIIKIITLLGMSISHFHSLI
jgi:hypothetical protein